MSPFAAFRSLLRQAPPASTVALLALMILASLSEGVSLLMLVPVLESVSGTGVPGAQFARLFDMTGFTPSLGVILTVFVILFSLRAVLVYIQQVLSSRYQARMVDRMRLDGFTCLFEAEWRWLAQRRASDHASILIAGIGRIAAGLNQGLALIVSLLTFLACTIAALVLSWQATLIVLVALALACLAFAHHRRHALRLGEGMSRANRTLQAGFDAGLSGIRLTKIVDGCGRRIAEIAQSMGVLRREQTRFVAATAGARAGLQAMSAVVLALIVYAASESWHIPAAALIVLVAIFARSAASLIAMQQQYHHWLHAVPAWQEFSALVAQAKLAAEPDATEDSRSPLPIADALAFRDIAFTYPGRSRPALDGVSLTIAPRTLTAIIGPSGAGKSSLADLLIGLIEPDQGSFTLDSVSITGSARRRWRRSVGYVEQDAFFFHDTIANNLHLAHPEATEEEMNAALQSASAAFIFALPAGLDTVIGDRGHRLSGGERQRLALARALIGNPSLLILDEATHALDPDNEAAVWAAVERLRGSCTIVAIGHRLPMLDRADQVVVLDSGRIVAQGPWAQIRTAKELAA